MIFMLLFLLAMICYLFYWHNILIPKNNSILLSLLAKRKHLLCIENVCVDVLKNGGDTDGGNFKMLIYQSAIILIKREKNHFSYSYILASKGFKDKSLTNHCIYYGDIKKTEIKYSDLEITFRRISKSIFNEFSKPDIIDTVLSIKLDENSAKVNAILADAKIAF